MNGRWSLSIVIPTYGREEVLLDTLRYLLQLPERADEILVVDQTRDHAPATESALGRLQEEGSIRWIRLSKPSIPHAMNQGLLAATGRHVLFLDDDIRPEAELVSAHRIAHPRTGGLVAGRVIQPWQEGRDFSVDTHFHFASLRPARIRDFMGGNFSVDREKALQLGGFDENFIGAAYRYEAEFAARFCASYGDIHYEPRACLHHLHAGSGGTRAHGHHLRTFKPTHSVGAYYFLLRARPPGWWWQLLWRPLRSVRTRHHLLHPWWIPLTLAAEARGLGLAWAMICRGPRYASPSSLERS